MSSIPVQPAKASFAWPLAYEAAAWRWCRINAFLARNSVTRRLAADREALSLAHE